MFRLTAILWLCNRPENIYMSPLRYRRTVTSAWSFKDLILKLNLYVPINQKQSRTQYWPLGNTPLYLFCDYAPLHSYWLLEAEKDDKMKRRVNRSKKLYNMLSFIQLHQKKGIESDAIDWTEVEQCAPTY